MKNGLIPGILIVIILFMVLCVIPLIVAPLAWEGLNSLVASVLSAGLPAVISTIIVVLVSINCLPILIATIVLIGLAIYFIPYIRVWIQMFRRN